MEFTICGGEETESSDVSADLEHGFAICHCLYSFWVKECLRWVQPGLHGPLLAVVVGVKIGNFGARGKGGDIQK